MGSLSTLKKEADTIALNIALLYKTMLKGLDYKNICISSDDIHIKRSINIESGQVVYSLKGTLGNLIDNPDVKVDIPTDLLRGLKRGAKQYERHKKNIPNETDIERLVRDYFITLGLVKHWQTNGGHIDINKEA